MNKNIKTTILAFLVCILAGLLIGVLYGNVIKYIIENSTGLKIMFLNMVIVATAFGSIMTSSIFLIYSFRNKGIA